MFFDWLPPFWLLAFTIFFCFVYQLVLKTWWFFDKRNLKYVRGLPLIGSTYRSTLFTESLAYDVKRLYDKFPNEHIIGTYNVFGMTGYMLRDPDLIKQMTITNFDHFQNHCFAFSEEHDPMMGRSLLVMRDEKWRRMRSTISPAFTGSKMRLMHSLIVETSKDFIASLGKEVDAGANEFEAKALLNRYTNDVIANCAFGIKINSMEDKDNAFYEYARKTAGFEGIKGLIFLGYIICPSVLSFFRVKLFEADDTNFFRSVIMNNIEQRIKNKFVRNDMIDLLIKARDSNLKHDQEDEDGEKSDFVDGSQTSDGQPAKTLEKWTDDDLVAQCFVFLLAGFDTVALTICFLLHELAVNPDIQAKLYDEISDVRKQLNGKDLDYNTLGKMKYLDMVVSESMRRWSPGPANDRVVTKPIVLENSDGTKVHLNVGEAVMIPSYALHMDEKHFPNPEKFDPERFSDENKGNIKPGTYIPFGIGPRSCIASRFAIMEVKTNIVYLLTDFVVEKSEQTQHPLKLKNGSAFLNAENGFWVKFVRREQE